MRQGLKTPVGLSNSRTHHRTRNHCYNYSQNRDKLRKKIVFFADFPQEFTTEHSSYSSKLVSHQPEVLGVS
jgi:hypothetical protein